MPAKYRDMQDFHEYYAGTRKAPYLTIFIGGNHEASNYLFELYYGGWVAPNIYYLGAANVVRVGPLRIAGLSGIWKGYNYNKPHHERLPYNEDDVKSAYHVRELDVRKLLQVRTQVDIGLSHDWPRKIEMHGDSEKLFRRKPDFRADSVEGKLGSVAARQTMDRLRPPHWFSAHLHCKFAAVVQHQSDTETIVIQPGDTQSANDNAIKTKAEDVRNEDEINLDLDGDDLEAGADPQLSSHPESRQGSVPDDVLAQLPAAFTKLERPPHHAMSHPDGITNTTTQFLALDKCLPNRHFLQLVEIDGHDAHTTAPSRPVRLEYDPEWLAITRVFAKDLVVGNPEAKSSPDRGEAHYLPIIEREQSWVEEHIVQRDKLQVPHNFQLSAPLYDAGKGLNFIEGPREYSNNQTRDYCTLLDIPNPFDMDEAERDALLAAGPRPAQSGFRQQSRGRGHHRGSSRGQRGRRH